MVTRVTYTQTDTHTVTYPSLVTLSQSIPQGRGSHSGLCASSLIGAFPSRIPSRVNLAACRITDIARGCSPPKSKSPGSRSTVIETAATSGSGGTQRGGSGGPSPNAASGCRLPNRRIQRSVALSETCTRHEPPSYSPITHTHSQPVSQSAVKLRMERMEHSRSRSCRARRRCQTRGGTPRRDPKPAWAARGTAAAWPLLPPRTSRGRSRRTPQPPARCTRRASARASRTTAPTPHPHLRSFSAQQKEPPRERRRRMIKDPHS